MKIETGGPAFPVPFVAYGDATREGMTLRDYFAARVISACQITVEAGKEAPDDADVQATAARFARAAYVIADAMLKARGLTEGQ